MNDFQSLANIIAILVKRIGGEVVIEEKDLQDPPVATVARSINGKIILTVE